ncbi:hypothetical protein GCM10022279_07820 [Comamonas faecalis]|uniref:Negative regulator of flagellin synthesis n=1 Tax=Comamonas faecalis TaxID=1387849 RepID=A0ABP7QSC7_9BURK
MKIGHNPDNAALRAQAAAAREQQAQAPKADGAAKDAPRAAAAGAGVPVTLSQTARSSQVTRSSADFNADKVKAVKASIENGTFKVNAEVVADKLLANAQETLSSTRG